VKRRPLSADDFSREVLEQSSRKPKKLAWKPSEFASAGAKSACRRREFSSNPVKIACMRADFATERDDFVSK